MDETEFTKIEIKKFQDISQDYIANKKDWDTSVYEVEMVRRQEDGLIVVDIVHEDDLKGIKGQPSKSIQLVINPKLETVEKELAFQ